MKRFIRTLFIFLIILLPFNLKAETTDFVDEYNSTSVIKTSSGEFDLIIDDKADILTEEEEIKLQDDMTSLLEYGNIAFVTFDSDYSSVSSKASSFYYSNFGDENGSLFLIDMKVRELYIYSVDSNSRIITDMKAYTITDNSYHYASNEDYYTCAKVTFQQMYSVLEGDKIAEPLRYFTSAIISLITSVFICFIYAYLSSRKKKTSINKLAKNTDSKFVLNNFHAAVTGQRRVYNPPSSSSSSSGGGGGGGGGGGSSGGGHRF